MSYSFKLDEPFAKGVRRVLLSQIDGAERRLAKDGDKPEAIHEARKSFKRVRALLRLVRSGIGEAAFERENSAIRDIASLLAGARDRHVLLETIKMLDVGGEARLATAAAKLNRALQATEATRPDAIQTGDLIASARDALKATRKRFRRLKLEPDSLAPIRRGIRRTQKQAIGAMRAAVEAKTDEAFHDWRKCAQQHWRHMKLLSPAWPRYFEARISASKALSEALGDDHDLSLLIAFARNRPLSGLTAAEVRAITVACQQKQAALRDDAERLGRVLLADRPKHLARHIAALWSAAEQTARVPAPLTSLRVRRAATAHAPDSDDAT